MKKTLFVTHWPGGGVWGLNQLIRAEYMEEQTGMRMADLSDIHISSSIGALPANVLLIPSEKDPSIPQFKAGDLIAPFKKCAALVFGGDGVENHHEQNVQHDLRHMLGAHDGRLARGMSRLLSDRTGNLHKNHNVFGKFLDSYVGDVKLENLMKSSITQAHHMETVSRACFTVLKDDLFDKNEWSDAVIANHGDLISVKDAIMATTAAPTMFDSYDIGGNHYVDFDHAYSPLAVLQLALKCLKKDPEPMNFLGQNHAKATDVHFLKIASSGHRDTVWDPVEYSNQGPLRMEKDLVTNAGLDQQKIDNATMEMMLGRENITFLSADSSALESETHDLPSADIFNGNKSNLNKIERFARKHAKTQREEMMRYAEVVVETRSKEKTSDPLSAFRLAANENDPAIKGSAEPRKSGWFSGGLSRLVSSFTI
ncbi:MAG: hypothetical protein COB76_06200 [Alphaproteobacteria bacterium]|nr:MAG: hypothetical protein COB76_06200 [Alphaproteobacteria bacterium]